MRLLLQYGPWTTFKTIERHHDEPYQGVDVSVCLGDISKHWFHSTAAASGGGAGSRVSSGMFGRYVVPAFKAFGSVQYV
jgi:hypothetical protein